MDAHAKVYSFMDVHCCGFIVNVVYNSEIDIDECTETSVDCEQLCSNTIGSYNCGCRSGYRLDSDGYTCNGIHTIMMKYIFYFMHNAMDIQ